MAFMKYVMFRVKHGAVSRDVPVMFPDILVHQEVARAMMPCMRRHFDNANISLVSAGDFDQMDCKCSGESTSLGLKARPEDGNIILTYAYLHGIVAEEKEGG
jgi:hypothetical protein